MKRFALILTVLGALAVLGTTSANAADRQPGHGYVGHSSYALGYNGYGYLPRRGHGGPAYVVPAYGHRTGYARRGYGATVHGGPGYVRSYGHGSGVRISTPYFGVRIGH